MRLRTGIKIETELTKKLELGVESQFRLNNNWSEFDKYTLAPALKYEWAKNWRLLTIYRYSWEQNKTNSRFAKHRASLFIGRKDNFGSDWSLKYKSGIEYEFRSFGKNYNPKYRNWTNRNEAMIVYDFFRSPFSVKGGSELFFKLNKNYRLEQLRFASEINYDLTEKSKVSIQFLLDFKLHAMGTKNYIWGLMYQLKI